MSLRSSERLTSKKSRQLSCILQYFRVPALFLFFIIVWMASTNNVDLRMLAFQDTDTSGVVSLPSLRQSPFFTRQKPTLHLIGERHSGTKWMMEHLSLCFNHSISVQNGLTRWKHWFQTDGQYATNHAVVVVMFRHVLQWVEAMRLAPYHAPVHFDREWYDFVTKPWTMPRTGKDKVLDKLSDVRQVTGSWQGICLQRFRVDEVVPCREHDAVPLSNDRFVTPLYELRHNGRGDPYESILELRRDKIRNFLSISDFERVDHMEVVRYEDLVEHGTRNLIKQLEQALGVRATCSPAEPQEHNIVLRSLPENYVAWMRKHVDWDVEALAGYSADDNRWISTSNVSRVSFINL